MNVHYRIIEINENEQTIVVRYYTDILTEEFLAISYDINGNLVTVTESGQTYPQRCRTDYSFNIWKNDITEEDIFEIVKNGIPVDWLKMMENVANNNIDTSLSNIQPLLYTSNTITITT